MSDNLKELIELGKPYLKQYLIDSGVVFTTKGSTEFFRCINPEHDDRNPSSSILDGGSVFHCFSCGISNNIYGAVHYLENKPLYGAGFIKDNLSYILEKYSIEHEPLEVPEEILTKYKYEVLYEVASKLLTEVDRNSGKLIHSDPKPARSRSWEEPICRTLGIGCVKDFEKFIQHIEKLTALPKNSILSMGINNRLFGPELLTFTVKDEHGIVRGFASRYINWKEDSNMPKYVNTSLEENPYYRKDHLLFGMNNIRKLKDMRLDIYEGYGSTVTANQAGYKNCCSIGGTALTEHHIEIIRNLGFKYINLVLDADETGMSKMDRYIDRFSGNSGLEVTIMYLPISEEDKKVSGQNDPDFFIKKYGIDAYRSIKPIDMFEHMLEKSQKFDSSDPAALGFCKKMVPLIINQADMLKRGKMVNALAAHTCVDKEDIKAEIMRLERSDMKNLKEDLNRKIRSVSNPDQMQDILSSALTNLEESVNTKKDRYLISVTESLDTLEDIFQEINTVKEGIHGWVTGYQALDSLLDGIPKPGTTGGRAIGFAGPPQHGKQISDDTPVLTTEGWKNHGDLKVGDYVFGRQGTPTKVTAVWPKNTQNCLVTFDNGEQIHCHENHEWVVFDSSLRGGRDGKNKKDKGERIRETKYFEKVSLTKTKKKRHRFSVDPECTIHFTDKELPLHPYILGAWLGDGRAIASDISHSKEDTQHIQKIEQLGLKVTNSWEHKTTRVVYSSFKGLIKTIKAMKLYANKHIPEIYLRSSVTQRLELLAGLIDADGSLHTKTDRLTFSNCNKRLIDQVAELVRSLGAHPSICSYEPAKGGTVVGKIIQGKQIQYQVSFNLPHKLPAALPRKQNKGTYTNRRKQSIVKVERTTEKIGNCITVNGGVYLVGRKLIPTHNSAAMLNIALNVALNNKDACILYWAIDDHRKAITYRLISMLSEVPMKKVLNTIKRTEEENMAISEAQDIIRTLTSEKKLVFKDDRFGRSKLKAETWIKDAQETTGSQILFCVDSLHNIQGTEGQEARMKIVSNSSWLKSLIASVPCTVLATIEMVKNKQKGIKPTLQEISESGKIEFDFDTLCVVWNEAQGNYTDVGCVNARWGGPGNWKPVIELDFQKNKAGSGEKGSIYVKYDTETTKILTCSKYFNQVAADVITKEMHGSAGIYTISSSKTPDEIRFEEDKDDPDAMNYLKI